MGDGFDHGSDDVLLLAIGKEEVKSGGEAIGVGNGREEIERTVNGLEAKRSGGAFGEGVREAGEKAGVTEILTEADSDVMRANELHREVDGEARQPVKEGADGRHAGKERRPQSPRYTGRVVCDLQPPCESFCCVESRSVRGVACYDHDRRVQRNLSGRGCVGTAGFGRAAVF